MMTAITTDPASDVTSPYADIERLPRLTAEEEARLLHDLRLAAHAPAAKARLIEGYLPRVLTLAKQYDRRYRVITFDDLVQEGSLALIRAIDKCAVMPITKSLSCYVGTVVRSAFARAIATDAPIHMPNSTWHYIHNTGRAQDYAWMQTMRLDAVRNADGETFAETLPAPALILPTGEQEQEQLQRDEQRRQLVPLLALLSERRRQVLTLRYGLDPADARAHSREETARLLGLSRGAVYDAEQRAIATLRHASETMAAVGSLPSLEVLASATPLAVARPRKPVTAGQRQYHQCQHAEQQAKLEAAFRSMQEQGLPITSETLKNTAHVDHRAACAFVKQHVPQSAERARIRAIPVEQRLEEAFAQMVARGETLSITGLKAAAHTDAPAARAFLRSRGIPRQWGGPPRKASRAMSDEPDHAASTTPRRDTRRRQSSSSPADGPLERVRLTLHEADPITGNEDLLSSLFYEEYRGYTIYSTPRGRCCIHGTQGCLKLRGRFVCFYDIEQAKLLIAHLRRAGYSAADRVERYLPEEEYVWLNWGKRPRQRTAARPVQSVP